MDLSYLRISTLVISMVTGVSLMIIAKHLRIPSIVPLLIGGILLGPEGAGLIDPEALESGLKMIVSLGVAIILFEGGLSLSLDGIRKASTVIWRLLSIGVLITWFGTAMTVYYLFGYSMSFSMLAGSLIIVTGPTVIVPLLNRIGIKEKLHHILHWEGVLIDPIGVFIAILCFEWFNRTSNAEMLPFQQFGLRLLVGIGIGLLGGGVLITVLKKDWIPREYANIFVLSMALFLFGMSDLMVHEAGILTVVVTGFILGWDKPPHLKNIQQFKSELTELFIALLFILLSATLHLEDFTALGWRGLILIAVVLLVIRPLSIVFCTFNTSLSIRDRLFLSWLSPRGIVAGSMASLFALRLKETGLEHASFLQSFTFSIIGVSVIIQGLTAGAVARFLKVKALTKNGWIIVGAHPFARNIANFITKTTQNVCLLVDLNQDAILEAQREGFLAYSANALSIESIPAEWIPTIGNVMALTDNRHLNQLICQRWAEMVGKDHVFRWTSLYEEPDSGKNESVGKIVWGNLPKPSQLGYALKNREAVIVHSTLPGALKNIRNEAIPLLVRRDTEIILEPSRPDLEASSDVLLFKQWAHHLPFFLHPEHILRFHEGSAEFILTRMLATLSSGETILSAQAILKEILDREQTFPTILSNGVAVPHVMCRGLIEPICMIAQIPAGVLWPGESDSPCHLVFLLLSPFSNPEIHLTLLAEIAKLASSAEIVTDLLAIEPSEKVIQYFIDLER
ncbi:MAG: cation:proton antiporter [SAR324 cluster bacterium]|nr:cation:proton antiporter [SAR324 cluster bacterium]